LAQYEVISATSKDYLLAALDPYHDREFDIPRGVPDGNTQRSVVRCINQTRTIGAPEGLAPGESWVCVISNNQFLNTAQMRLIADLKRNNNVVLESLDGTSNYVGSCEEHFIDIDVYGEDGDPDYAQIAKPADVTASYGFSLDPTLARGIGRFVGCGIEVHNVTAELYRSGTVTVGEVPQATIPEWTLNQLNVLTTDTTNNTLNPKPRYQVRSDVASTVRAITNRPSTLSQAMMYPGSQQWEAKDGLYMVLAQQGQCNEPAPPEYVFPVFWNQEIDEDPNNSVNSSALLVVPTESAADVTIGQCTRGPMKWAPLSSKFAYFSGLSQETKLTINCRLFYESFPSYLQTDILTLSSPSPDMDPHAMAIYQHCMTHLPIGVPVGMNGLGEWFAEAVSEFADVAGLGLSALGVPFATQIAGGAKALADRYIKTQAKKDSAQGKTTTATVLASKKKKKAAKQKQPGVLAPNMQPMHKK